MRKKIISILWLIAAVCLPQRGALASDYVIDTEGGHAFIQFRISHLGYSWLVGRFNSFSGAFSYDEDDPGASRVSVVIDTASIDSNHAERDKHLRDGDFLDVEAFPQARFESRTYTRKPDGSGELVGDLTLRGVTRPIVIAVEQVGAGPDPWGGYRMGFSGHTRLVLADFGITTYLGDAAREMELFLGVEGIREKSEKASRRPGP
ncbi:MAG: YceI family protein [Candidatus Thiodiazotropha sp.]